MYLWHPHNIYDNYYTMFTVCRCLNEYKHAGLHRNKTKNKIFWFHIGILSICGITQFILNFSYPCYLIAILHLLAK